MEEPLTNNNNVGLDNEMSLQEFFNILLSGKWTIVSVTAFVSIIGVIYSLSLPNIYSSNALLVPVNTSGSIARSLNSYTTVASLAGINLPSTANQPNSLKAVKKIDTLSFFENNILPNIYLPDLMAAESWNSKTNTMVYDESIFDTVTNSWVKSDSSVQKKMPSPQISYRAFKSKHLTITDDRKTGFVTISIKHKSPFLAKQWAELVVNEINSFYRQKDKLESEKAVRYLNQQISKTALSEINEVLAKLLQEEIKKLTLIEANEYYVFDFIDPPAVMEKKIEPSRALICILFSLMGGILSILLVFYRHYKNN